MQRTLLLFACFLFFASLACGATLYIDVFGKPTSKTCTKLSPCTNLKDALTIAQANDVIMVAAGAYAGSNNIGVTIAVNNLTIGGDPNGQQSFSCPSSGTAWTLGQNIGLLNVVNIGFSLCAKGVASSYAGAILNFTNPMCTIGSNLVYASNAKTVFISNLKMLPNSGQSYISPQIIYANTVTNLVIVDTSVSVNNTFVQIVSSGLYMKNATISNSQMGAIVANNTCTMELYDTVFKSNGVRLSQYMSVYPPVYGGALTVPANSDLYADNCTWDGNGISWVTSYDSGIGGDFMGGAFYVGDGATATIVNSKIINNYVTGGDINYGMGGGVAIDGGALQLRNTLVDKNHINCVDSCNGGYAKGGAFWCRANGVVTLLDSTITNNNCPTDTQNGGGVMYCASPCSISATNTVISGNSSPTTKGSCSGLS